MWNHLLFRAGMLYRNPSLPKLSTLLKRTEGWSLAALQDYQVKEMKKFLTFVDSHSPYYNQYFKKAGFDPGSFHALEDLRKLPPTTKATLIEQNDQIHTRSSFRKPFLCETSGSTGQVLTFRRNEEWDSMNRAAMFRGYRWHGVQPWTYNVYFWGYNIDPKRVRKVRRLDRLQNRYRIFDYTEESLLQLIRRLPHAHYIHGYSSMIYETARLLNERFRDLRLPHLKMVKGTSEKIFPHYQEEVQKAFGRRMTSEYGAAEAGMIAFECPEGNMHINMEGCYVEEESGEILVTNYLSYSFPVIRYRLGDSVRIADPGFRCRCGMQHTVIEEVTGRVGKLIYGIRNTYPSLTLYYVFKNLYFESDVKLNYQCIQEKKGELLVKIAEQPGDTAKDLLNQEFKKYFGNDLSIAFRFGEPIHSFREKLQDFISLIESKQ